MKSHEGFVESDSEGSEDEQMPHSVKDYCSAANLDPVMKLVNGRYDRAMQWDSFVAVFRAVASRC
eukprot:15161908-Alexandrium_andersonii.AAC.1